MKSYLHDVINLSIVVVFSWIFWFQSDQGVFGNPFIDLIWIIAISLRASSGEFRFSECALWMVLTRHQCLNAADHLRAFPQAISLFWLVWSVLLSLSRQDFTRAVLLGAWLGLTFDPGVSPSIGMGMSIGWEALPLNLLLLSGITRFLLSPPKEFRLPRYHAFLLLLTGSWLLIHHWNGPSAFLTGKILASVTLIFIFQSFLFSYPGGKTRFFQAVTLSSLPLILSAFGIALFSEEGPMFVFQKRLSAGDLHPNLFAAFSLFTLVFLAWEKDWEFLPENFQTLAKWSLISIGLLTLFVSGGRASLAILVLIILVSCGKNWGGLSWKKAALGLLLIGFVGWRIWSVSQTNEWIQNERLFIWRSVGALIQQQPIRGFGLMAYGHLPQTMPPHESPLAYDWNYPHSHNLFLEAILSGGIPCLLFLLLFAGFGLSGERSRTMFFPICLAVLAQGLFDFVWYSPCLVALSLGAFLPGNCADTRVPTTPVSEGETTIIPERKGWPALPVLGAYLLISGFLFIQGSGDALFRDGLKRLLNKDPSFQSCFDRARELQPNHLQMRLQRLYIRWATGANPLGDLAETADMAAMWPEYYLPEYLLGRLSVLAGNASEASGHFARSVAQEPHDTYGIRWAHLALSQEASGQDCSGAALQALTRNCWGPAILLDHPTRGQTFWNYGLAHALASPTFALGEKLGLLHLFYYGLPRKFGVEAFTALCNDPRFLPCPEMSMDLFEALKLEAESQKSDRDQVLQRCLADHSGFGLSRQIWIAQTAADFQDASSTAAAVARIREIWAYRNKNSDYLPGDFFLLNVPGATAASSALDLARSLDSRDPGNPWIQELIGDIQARKNDPQEALQAFRSAQVLGARTRFEPVFSAGPRPWIPGPTGEEWTLSFEKIFRSREALSGAYHQEAWQRFFHKLETKCSALEHAPTKAP